MKTSPKMLIKEKRWRKQRGTDGYVRYFNKWTNIPKNFLDYLFISEGVGYLNLNYDIPLNDKEDYQYALDTVYHLARKNFKPLTDGRTLTIPNSAGKDTMNNTRLQHYFKWRKDRLPTEEEFQEFRNAVAGFNNDLDKFKRELNGN